MQKKHQKIKWIFKSNGLNIIHSENVKQSKIYFDEWKWCNKKSWTYFGYLCFRSINNSSSFVILFFFRFYFFFFTSSSSSSSSIVDFEQIFFYLLLLFLLFFSIPTEITSHSLDHAHLALNLDQKIPWKQNNFVFTWMWISGIVHRNNVNYLLRNRQWATVLCDRKRTAMKQIVLSLFFCQILFRLACN